MTRLVIAGASGRMGQVLLRVLPEFPEFALHGALVRPGSVQAGAPPFGCDAALMLRGAGLVIDFSTASASEALVGHCRALKVPLLVGTTGLGPAAQAALDSAAGVIPVLQTANTSIGIAVLQSLVQRAAAVLPGDFDIEVYESHHRGKLDAPSGTALALAESAAAGRRSQGSETRSRPGSDRQGRRQAGDIGFAVVRGGDVIGEHEVRFLGSGEQLSLGHRVNDRAIFARGALRVGAWLARQPPGRYRMADFLGLP